MRTIPPRSLTIQLKESELGSLRAVLEYKYSHRRRARNAGPVLPPDADDASLLRAVKTAVQFAGRCARERMAEDDRDFESEDSGGWDMPKWGEVWNCDDLSDDMSERPCEEL